MPENQSNKKEYFGIMKRSKRKNPPFGGFVRMEGLEPPCLAALDPKSSASTNFATSAINFSLSTLVLSKASIVGDANVRDLV